MSDLTDLVQGEPDEFVDSCRDALRETVASLPPALGQLLYEQSKIKSPWSTLKQHQAWLDSYQYKAMTLELQLKQQEKDSGHSSHGDFCS